MPGYRIPLLLPRDGPKQLNSTGSSEVFSHPQIFCLLAPDSQ